MLSLVSNQLFVYVIEFIVFAFRGIMRALDGEHLGHTCDKHNFVSFGRIFMISAVLESPRCDLQVSN